MLRLKIVSHRKLWHIIPEFLCGHCLARVSGSTRWQIIQSIEQDFDILTDRGIPIIMREIDFVWWINDCADVIESIIEQDFAVLTD